MHMRDLIKGALHRTGLFPVARAAYRKLNRSIAAQRTREIEFYRALLPRDALCFDIGANLGQKAEVLLTCGRVVIVEPNDTCIPTLQFHFARNPKATILHTGLAASRGTAELYVHGSDSTASMNPNWDRKVYGKDRKPRPIVVQTTTLDDLIVQFGIPDYVKIDVEGFELEVLRGLSGPVPLVSIEYHSDTLHQTELCLAHLSQFGHLTLRASDMNCQWITPAMATVSDCMDHIAKKRAEGDLFVWVK
jgi:FkbM family methyltransferase